MPDERSGTLPGSDRGSHVTPWTRGAIGVLLATLGYLSVAVAGAIASGNAEFVIYIAVMGALFAIIARLHRSVRLPTPLLAALSFWGLLHMAGGLVPVPASWPIGIVPLGRGVPYGLPAAAADSERHRVEVRVP